MLSNEMRQHLYLLSSTPLLTRRYAGMNGLLDLPVEIVVDRVPKKSLFGPSLTCRSLNYLSTSALLERCGIRDPTNCTFYLYATEGQADALSAF